MTDVKDIITALIPGRGPHIDGVCRSGSAGTLPVEDPATRVVIAEVANGGTDNTRAAVDAAVAGAAGWASTAPRERSEVLRRAFELMLRDRDRLAALIAAENGKSFADAVDEVGYAADFFRWFAEEAVRPGGEYGESPSGGSRTVVTHRPIDVAALVTPDNEPSRPLHGRLG